MKNRDFLNAGRSGCPSLICQHLVLDKILLPLPESSWICLLWVFLRLPIITALAPSLVNQKLISLLLTPPLSTQLSNSSSKSTTRNVAILSTNSFQRLYPGFQKHPKKDPNLPSHPCLHCSVIGILCSGQNRLFAVPTIHLCLSTSSWITHCYHPNSSVYGKAHSSFTNLENDILEFLLLSFGPF